MNDDAGRVGGTTPAVPTCAGPPGIRFDVNDGCRIRLPPGDRRGRLTDLETGGVPCDIPCPGGTVRSAERYFVRYHVELWLDGVPVFSHRLDLAGREVLIRPELGGLGDQLAWAAQAWAAQAAAFAAAHGARVTCCVTPALVPLLAPDAARAAAGDRGGAGRRDRSGAVPRDLQGLHRPSGRALPRRRAHAGPGRGGAPAGGGGRPGRPPIDGAYVCIGAQASSQAEYCNNPQGWTRVIAFLKAAGDRVVCIDQRPAHGRGLVWNHLPHGAEDQTGDRPLSERARWLRHAAFHVGLSSGLSWLAWAVGTPVVMITGLTLALNEFATEWRVGDPHACDVCANDTRHRFDPTDVLWCPRHAGTARQFECSRLITAERVQAVIRRIPGFGAGAWVVPAPVGRPA